MNTYDEALYKVVNQMLAAKDCKLEDRFMFHSLVERLRDKIREIGIRTSNASNHAGRTMPTLFDLERTFGQMGVYAADLKDMCDSKSRTLRPIRCPAPRTRDEDYHKGPIQKLTEISTRELTGCSHIPENFPPFPGSHTYKSTLIKKNTEKSYEDVRFLQAMNQCWVQRALNGFYVGSEPSLSLAGSDRPKDDCFKVLIVNPRQKMACVDALMPRSEIFEKDIYESKEEITHGALHCPFLMEPKMKSTHEYNGGEDVVMYEVPKDEEQTSNFDDDEINWSVSD